MSKALRAQCASTWPRLQPSSNDGTDECLRTETAPRTPVTALQMLRRYGATARSARARRTYDRIMAGDPDTGCDWDAPSATARCHPQCP